MTRFPVTLRSRWRDRWRTPRPWIVVTVLAGCGLIAWLVADYARVRRESVRLEQRLERLEARGLTREELQTQLARELARTRATVRGLVRERSLGRTLLEEHAGEVCLVHVTYRYVDERTGVPMRVSRPGGEGSVVIVHDVFGTGFPVAPGVLLSNRHVLQPWWQSPEAETSAREGFVARALALRALCPGEDRPLPLALRATSPTLDLATASFPGGALDPLPIAPAEREVRSGFSIFLLGYPTGLRAALARASEADRRALLPLLERDPGAVADSLLAHGQLQPLLTFGRVNEVHGDRITFDAPTARGSSGGPLFNVRGEVIGVSSELLRGFAGANFAIPLQEGDPLLSGR
ncbi:MAG: serine protease [Gemmatimonadota bacterium]